MANRWYSDEEAYLFMSLTDSDEEVTHLSNSCSEYDPVDDSGSLTDSSDDGVVPARVRRTRPRSSAVAEVQEPQGSRMEERSTSAAIPSGELASTSGLVHPGHISSTAVTLGDVASPISAVQAGEVASTSSVPLPPRRRRQRQARPHSTLPAAFANPDWVPTTSAAPVLPPFTGQPGIQVNTVDFTSLDFYSLYFTEDLYRSIVDQSNLYAGQFFAANPQLSLARDWKPITVSEFKIFLGLSLNMGITKKSELRMYWSTHPVHHMPIFSASMARTRYEQILRFMHFSDNELCRPRGDPEFDRLYKIRPLVNHFNERFAALYNPNQVVCVDESLVKFSGRLSFKQFLPSKRARYGVKLYKLCDRATGYTSSFMVYEGKDSHVEPENCPDYIGSAGKIVWELVSPLFGKGYHLYVDNYYTSVPLFSHLFDYGIGACGTVRPNRRGIPQRLVESRLSRGERACLRCNNLLAVKWRDSRNVFVLSTLHADTAVQIPTATGVVEKPLCIHEYNLNMGGVDLNDQLLAPYLIARRSKRWYKKVSVYLFQLALLNAHVLYRASGRTGSFLKFQEEIVEALLFPDGAVPHLPNANAVSRLYERHFPFVLAGTPTRKSPQKRCRVCSKLGFRRDTRFYCPDCPDQPGLCIGACFKRYHTLVEF